MDVLQMQNWLFLPEPPEDLAPIRDFLRRYSHVPADEVDGHLVRIRNDAWKIAKTPSLGRWKFLDLIHQNDSRYQQVLFRLTLPESTDALLDVGCCVGQVIRQLRADGVDGAKLFGTDLLQQYFDVGYSLFRDRDTLDATFIAGDMIDPDDQRLSSLEGKVTMVHAGSFFHLFSWIQQSYICKRLISFMRPGTKNGYIWGKLAGTVPSRGQSSGRKSQDVDIQVDKTAPFLHTADTFQKLWEEVGFNTGTRWKVVVEPVEEQLGQRSGTVIPIVFSVFQIS